MPRLTVERREEWPDAYSVVHDHKTPGAGKYICHSTSEAVAWYRACTLPFHEENVVPIVGPGGWFVSDSGRGWTSDPRFAQTMPAHKATPEQIKAAEEAVIRYVRHRLGETRGVEVFMPDKPAEEFQREHDLPGMWEASDLSGGEADSEQAAGVAESPSPEVSGDEGHEDAPETSEAVREDSDLPEWDAPTTPVTDPRDGLSESDRNALDNYMHLAATAPSEQAREYWAAKVRELSDL